MVSTAFETPMINDVQSASLGSTLHRGGSVVHAYTLFYFLHVTVPYDVRGASTLSLRGSSNTPKSQSSATKLVLLAGGNKSTPSPTGLSLSGIFPHVKHALPPITTPFPAIGRMQYVNSKRPSVTGRRSELFWYSVGGCRYPSWLLGAYRRLVNNEQRNIVDCPAQWVWEQAKPRGYQFQLSVLREIYWRTVSSNVNIRICWDFEDTYCNK